jgi:hypothetical protein
VINENADSSCCCFLPFDAGYWEKGPLPEELASAPQARTYLDDSELKTQAELYSQLESMTHRAAVIRTIALSNNPEAIRILEGIVRKRKTQYAVTMRSRL